MKRRYSSYSWLVVLAAGFVLACGAGRAGAADKQHKVIVKEKGKPGKKKIMKIIRAGEECCPDFAWYGKKKRGFLGVHLLKLNQELRAHFGSDKDAGILIARVEKDSPAEKAGVRVGDLLAEIDGEKVASVHQVVKLIGKKKDGEPAKLKIVRKGKPRSLTVTIQERERSQLEVSRFIRKLPGGGEEIEIEVDSEHLERAVERAEEYLHKFHDDEQGFFKFRHKMESDMQERLKEMEERLKELEKKLQGKIRKSVKRRTT